MGLHGLFYKDSFTLEEKKFVRCDCSRLEGTRKHLSVEMRVTSSKHNYSDLFTECSREAWLSLMNPPELRGASDYSVSNLGICTQNTHSIFETKFDMGHHKYEGVISLCSIYLCAI
jgi:hypothetical protein